MPLQLKAISNTVSITAALSHIVPVCLLIEIVLPTAFT